MQFYLNQDSPPHSHLGNKEPIGSEYGSPNMDQDSNNASNPSITSTIHNLISSMILLPHSSLSIVLSYYLLSYQRLKFLKMLFSLNTITNACSSIPISVGLSRGADKISKIHKKIDPYFLSCFFVKSQDIYVVATLDFLFLDHYMNCVYVYMDFGPRNCIFPVFMGSFSLLQSLLLKELYFPSKIMMNIFTSSNLTAPMSIFWYDFAYFVISVFTHNCNCNTSFHILTRYLLYI